MIAELGTFSLLLCMILALLSSSYIIPTLRNRIGTLLITSAWLQLSCAAIAFFSLMILRIQSDFSVENVVLHSNETLPLLYKIVGTWGNHEGSMLLWLCIMLAFPALFSLRNKDAVGNMTLSIQAILSLGIIAFIIFTSSPFTRVVPPPFDGQTLNPLLQDVALSIHPPLLYVGYVGFSLVFSFAVAALLTTGITQDWAKRAHSWIMLPWAALTLGIGLGSWWAYRELGWGGWWFWDPVENASLLPWLAGTALFHANKVLINRNSLAHWVALLSIVTFGLSLLGTFLVRSGILTSVHSFANDPDRGLFILIYILSALGGGLFIYGLKFSSTKRTHPLRYTSKEGLILINNLFIMVACALVLIGTVYPLLLELFTGTLVSVGAPYYNSTLLPLMIIPIIIAGLSGYSNWNALKWQRTKTALLAPLSITLAIIAIAYAYYDSHITMTLLGVGLSTWLLTTSVAWLKSGTGKRHYAVAFGHSGLAIFIAGITIVGLHSKQEQTRLAHGTSITTDNYIVELQTTHTEKHANYNTEKAIVNITNHNQEFIGTLAPEYRTYHISNINTNEVAIISMLGKDLHAIIGEFDSSSQTRSVRFYEIPMIHLIWIGFVLMSLGGCIAASTKRNYKIDHTEF